MLRYKLLRLSVILLPLFSSAICAFPDRVTPTLPDGYDSECLDCHVAINTNNSCTAGAEHPGKPCLNPFGSAYLANGWYTALGEADTDGDGMKNDVELSVPGSAGFPAGAESVSCNALQCATATSLRIACGVSHVMCRATAVSPGDYSFGFSCESGWGPDPLISDTNWADRCITPIVPPPVSDGLCFPIISLNDELVIICQ